MKREYIKVNDSMQMWQESYFSKAKAHQREVMNELDKQTEDLQMFKHSMTKQSEQHFLLANRCI